MRSKIKLLILQLEVPNYRIPIFNYLSEIFNLTVACSKKVTFEQQCNFKTLLLPYRNVSKFILHKDDIQELADQFDVVIYLGNIAILKYALLPFKCHRKFKTIVWTIGVSASYSKKYDANHKWDFVRDFFYKKADACLFYTDYPVQKYISRGFAKDSLFVANNTVEVIDTLDKQQKDTLLFIGSLYKQKGITDLLDAYYKAYTAAPNIPRLNIIGKGEEFDNIQQWIKQNNMESKVELLGPIYEDSKKEMYFKKALATISPNQAGLSVLESMGYGTPFVTSQDAITGGERFNIRNGETGVLYDTKDDLAKILIDITNNPQKYIDMGENAARYYRENRTAKKMVQGFVDAVNYVMGNA